MGFRTNNYSVVEIRGEKAKLKRVRNCTTQRALNNRVFTDGGLSKYTFLTVHALQKYKQLEPTADSSFAIHRYK